MIWATERARILGKAPPMSLDDVITALRDQDAALYVQDGRLEYARPDLDASLAAGIDQHRGMLTELFTYAPGGRCVMTDCYRLVGVGERTLCPDHRAESDLMVMPWESER